MSLINTSANCVVVWIRQLSQKMSKGNTFKKVQSFLVSPVKLFENSKTTRGVNLLTYDAMGSRGAPVAEHRNCLFKWWMPSCSSLQTVY